MSGNKSFAPGLLLCTGLALTLGNQLQGQTFQSVYGAENDDAARGGVVQTRDGGFISVGESRSFGNGDYDVYVVKTDQCGNLEWSTTYDFGGGKGDDIGRKIRETVDDGYIIVGSTNDAGNCCSHDNIFLLKIDIKGNVEWLKTYGGREDDQGWDVQLYQGGKEYVVAGRSASFGAGKYDAYLLRTDFFGNVIQARVYGGRGTDGFNSVAVDDATGDILAGGETNSYGWGNQLLLGRFNFDLQTLWLNHYGGDRDEAANSVIFTVKGTAVAAGYSTSLTGARDGYILRVNAATGAWFDDRVYFPIDAAVDDEFKEIRELRDAGLATVGYSEKAPNGFGDHDVWLLTTNFGLNAGPQFVYGAERFDEGWSLSVNYRNDDAAPDYTLAGVTTNWAFGGEDLYLIRTDQNLKSGCNENETKSNEKQPGWKEMGVRTCQPSIIVECDQKTEPRYNESWKVLCQDCGDKGRNQNANQFNLGMHSNGLPQNNAVSVSSSVAGPTGADAQR